MRESRARYGVASRVLYTYTRAFIRVKLHRAGFDIMEISLYRCASCIRIYPRIYRDFEKHYPRACSYALVLYIPTVRTTRVDEKITPGMLCVFQVTFTQRD